MIISLVNSKNVGGSIGEIKQFIYCFTAYFLILFTIKDGSQFRKIIIFIVCAGFLVSVFGIMEGSGGNIYTYLHKKSLFGAPLPRSVLLTGVNRIGGLIGDADSHGMYMGIIFLFAFYLVLTTRSKILKTILMIIMLISLFNIIGAASRGAALGFLISFVVFWILIGFPRKWFVLTIVLGLFLAIALLMIKLIPDLDIERFYDPKAKGTIELRADNIIIGLSMAKDHPIIGSGPDGYMMNYLRYGPRITPSARRIRTKSLNAYVQALVEYGIVGFTLFSLITFFIIRSLIILRRNLKGEPRSLAAVVLAVFCGYTFFMNTTGFVVSQTYWLLVALGSTLATIPLQELQSRQEHVDCNYTMYHSVKSKK
jgi:O-antigen ligase